MWTLWYTSLLPSVLLMKNRIILTKIQTVWKDIATFHLQSYVNNGLFVAYVSETKMITQGLNDQQQI